MRSVTVTLSDPVIAAAPALVSQTSRIDWRDQVVVALGLAHRVSEALAAYAGLNRARSPVRSETLTPLLAAIAERHLTGGLAWRLADGWAASCAFEYQQQRRVDYRNPNLPLGESAQERSRYLAINLMVSRRW